MTATSASSFKKVYHLLQMVCEPRQLSKEDFNRIIAIAGINYFDLAATNEYLSPMSEDELRYIVDGPQQGVYADLINGMIVESPLINGMIVESPLIGVIMKFSENL